MPMLISEDWNCWLLLELRLNTLKWEIKMGNKMHVDTSSYLTSLLEALERSKETLSPDVKKAYLDMKKFGETPEEMVMNACLGGN